MRNLPNNNRRATSETFFDDWESNFDKNFKRTTRGIAAAWAIGLLINLVFWGVVIWAIIELVQHFTR